jgi:hypothetical protein
MEFLTDFVRFVDRLQTLGLANLNAFPLPVFIEIRGKHKEQDADNNH